MGGAWQPQLQMAIVQHMRLESDTEPEAYPTATQKYTQGSRSADTSCAGLAVTSGACWHTFLQSTPPTYKRHIEGQTLEETCSEHYTHFRKFYFM